MSVWGFGEERVGQTPVSESFVFLKGRSSEVPQETEETLPLLFTT